MAKGRYSPDGLISWQAVLQLHDSRLIVAIPSRGGCQNPPMRMRISTCIAAARYVLCIDTILRWHPRERISSSPLSFVHEGSPLSFFSRRFESFVDINSQYRVDQSDCMRSVSHCATLISIPFGHHSQFRCLPLTCCVRYKYVVQTNFVRFYRYRR